MKKVLLPSFGAHLFGLQPEPETLTLHLPPVLATPHGLDLDFMTLLLFEKVIADKHAFDYVTSSALPAHQRLRETFNILANEGILELCDYAQIARQYERELQEMRESEMRDPLAWVDESRGAIVDWKQTTSKLAHLVDLASHPKVRIPFGIWLHLQRCGLPLSEKEVNRVEKAVLRKARSRRIEEMEMLKDVARPYLDSVHLNLILTRETGSAVYDWDVLGGFYKTKFLRSASPHGAIVREEEKIRELFSAGIPEYQPRSAKEYVTLCKDKRIKHLRTLIQRSVDEDRVLDHRFYETAMEQLIENRRKVEVIRRRTAILTAPLLLIHGVGHFVREAVMESVERIANRKFGKEHQWLLLLVDRQRHKSLHIKGGG